MYLTDVDGEELALDSAQLLWSVPLEYGNWEDGPMRDGGRTTDVTIPVPTVGMATHTCSRHGNAWLPWYQLCYEFDA